MSPTEIHMPVETFLGAVWPYDKLWKCSPDDFLSDALTLVVIRQLLKDPTYFVKKVHFTPQKKASFKGVYLNAHQSLFPEENNFQWENNLKYNNPRIKFQMMIVMIRILLTHKRRQIFQNKFLSNQDT